MSSVIMPTSGIHETAIIHPSAKIGKDVSVGPYAVILKSARIATFSRAALLAQYRRI